MSCLGSGMAEEKFWQSPDLLEQFLPFLDAPAVLALAQSQISCTLVMLKSQENPSIWKETVKRSIPDPDFPENEIVSDEHLLASFEEMRTQALHLTDLLKLMQASNNIDPNNEDTSEETASKSDASSQILSLFKIICERFAQIGEIQVAFPSNDESHLVSVQVFNLLEEIQLALACDLLEITAMGIHLDLVGRQYSMSALASRALTQMTKITKMDLGLVILTTKNCVDSLSTLIQNTKTVCLGKVEVRGNIGIEGWSALANAFESSSVEEIGIMTASRGLINGSLCDIEAIFNCLTVGWEDPSRVTYHPAGILTYRYFPAI